jgi:hypothetical protein
MSIPNKKLDAEKVKASYDEEFLASTEHKICCKLQYKQLVKTHGAPINFFSCKKCGLTIITRKVPVVETNASND